MVPPSSTVESGERMDNNTPNDPVDPALDYELPASYALMWKNDEIAQFPSANHAIDYGRREMDSFYVVHVQTGEIVASKCLHAQESE